MRSPFQFIDVANRKLQMRRFRALLGRQGHSPRCLLAYIPRLQQGWILEFLWKDICQELEKIPEVTTGMVADPQELRAAVRGFDVFVVALSVNDLNALLDQGFPPERIIFYQTHVRLGVELLKLDLLHAVLVLNSFERELIAMRKVERRRIHLFPAGYDPGLFAVPESSRVRPIDVLFVGRYRRGKDGYYHKRKRYGFQVALAQQLLNRGLSVTFLGQDWEASEYPLDQRITLLERPHSDYGSIYQDSRMVCSVAGQEGGPVSFLEGLACGCLMVSAPTGFIADMHLAAAACWTMPLLASEAIWAEEIEGILASNSTPTPLQQAEREHYLEAARFSSLARQLVDIGW